jgi:hypothetical protein
MIMSGQLWNRMAVVVLALAATACGDDYGNDGNDPDPLPVGTAITASGSLVDAIRDFRASLGGDSANRDAGEQLTGRREVNWEGVQAPNLNTNTFPGDLFNTVITRGQVFGTNGIGLRVSNNDGVDIDSTYAAQFNAFSGTKTFFSVGSPRVDVTFQVAGSATEATVNGFGVVFSDVDSAGATFVDYYTPGGILLKHVVAPVRSDSAGFSFVGVTFEEPVVGFVRIISGQQPLVAGQKDVTDGGDRDIVIMDDFISGEPHAIPAAN